MDDLRSLSAKSIEGEDYISDAALAKAWKAGLIPCAERPKIGRGTRSLEEVILVKLLGMTLPGCRVQAQLEFGDNKPVDLKLSYKGKEILIDFLGPEHFIKDRRIPFSPLARRQALGDHFGIECVLWPYWIQLCSRNVWTLVDATVKGMASLWSVNASFSDFFYPTSAAMILKITDRFKAIRASGIGYMYESSHTTKPVHPVVAKIQNGDLPREALVPRGNTLPLNFWLPRSLQVR